LDGFYAGLEKDFKNFDLADHQLVQFLLEELPPWTT
jgi:hypothetical protein